LVIFLSVHCTKIEYEVAALVATAATATTASNNNITGDDNTNNYTMTINTSNDTLQQIFMQIVIGCLMKTKY
jgi:hypothetical protein